MSALITFFVGVLTGFLTLFFIVKRGAGQMKICKTCPLKSSVKSEPNE